MKNPSIKLLGFFYVLSSEFSSFFYFWLMKIINLSNILIFFLVIITCSCKKNKEETIMDKDTPLQLMKITAWNSNTGEEYVRTLFSYDDSGRIKTLNSSNIDYKVTYDSNGNLVKLSGNNSAGGEVSYTMSYDSKNQMTKVDFISMDPTDTGFIKKFEYNAAGKVSKTIYYNKDGLGELYGTIEEFIWEGDNITTLTRSSLIFGKTVYTYPLYDDKISPFTLGGVFSVIFNGFPVSKNNFIYYEFTPFSSASRIPDRVITYNSEGYATSIYRKDAASGYNGHKFYYNR